MAKPSIELITALRATSDRIEAGERFYWNHMGSCNCGHLAQTLTNFSKEEIHAMALENAGDWAEQAREYCPDSGFPLDTVIESMVAAGMNVNDIANLERLGDPEVLAFLPSGTPPLDYRRQSDAVAYIRAFADMLEAKWRRAHASKKRLRSPAMVE